MKNLFILILLTVSTSISISQVMPEAFVGLLPAIPNDACSMKRAERDNYSNYIDSVMQLIDNERERRDKENEAKEGDYKKQIEDKASKQTGLSQEDIKKLENKDLNEKEKEAIINKALQNKANLSLDELKNLKKMDKEGKKAWIEAYSTEKMAEVQADPKKNQAQQSQAKRLYDVSFTLKHIIDSLTAIETKFGRQMEEIDNDPEAKVMLDNIYKWEEELAELVGESTDEEGQRMKELSNKIKMEKERYCSKYTPKYLDILKRYESYAKSCLPVCYRIESISTEQAKLQMGVELKQEPGLVGIGKVADYLHLLRGVFKYNLLNE